MAVQYSTSKSGLVEVDDPIRSTGMKNAATKEAIKQLLAGGIPDWYKHPEEYKAFVKESFQAEKEASDAQVEGYKMPHQDLLADEKPRKVHPIATREFVKRLRDNGVRCFTVDNNLPGTVALWAARGQEIIYICYLQVPAQYEWSVLRLDAHNLPNGERFRGWRTVLMQLIIKGIMTEERAHRIFGKPTGGIVSSIYRKTLWTRRNKMKAEPSADLTV
jgi:hypothetical protein